MTNPIDWASDANYPAGSEAWSGTSTKIAPSAGQIAAGVAPRAKLPAQWFNYIVRNLVTVLNEKLYGPNAAVTDNAIARFDGTGGSTIQQSGVTIDDSGNVALPNNAGVNVEGSGNYNFTTPRSRTRDISHHAFKIQPGATVLVNNNDYQFQTNSAYCWIELGELLPAGCTITKVEAMVTPGAVRAGANRMYLSIVQRTGIVWSPGSLAYGTGTAPTVVYDNGINTNLQLIDSGTVSYTPDTNRFAIFVGAGNTANANNDYFHGVRITFTDPGPRN